MATLWTHRDRSLRSSPHCRDLSTVSRVCGPRGGVAISFARPPRFSKGALVADYLTRKIVGHPIFYVCELVHGRETLRAGLEPDDQAVISRLFE